jgi:hypothetical protein
MPATEDRLGVSAAHSPIHERPGSCGYHTLMIAMDTRACPVIILDP